ncbi:hypothetical protein AAA799E16_01511 [Marine Group I thaumarchaeote SCGC AAA799-E16]|uniref:DUF302 domain-containing protein n=4 Tax=Marine Group I TaxID=905826 RepID=A0A081RMI9_9ARCH|nr:hypothetical protein AAA799N04_01116 [Marine Group I thaumarchaeote SCGC AAA799-N04]KER05785.1 hypothetical protein AAA799E16_01511 [Marine Group I thaumarchaeote SCGC AAA799-E16]KFM15425.1 hypothetical protein AAA799D11_01333 [Marine Group I thaumarchaeote SCGC AAA799-D11]KFM16536.1 hypothetical protein SCCGRSA3_02230 [Marine Group I thaumarchaeote SCGC RSA3]
MAFDYSVKTQKNIDDVISEITTKLSEIKFGVLGTLDFKEIFAKKGVDYTHQYKLLEVCNSQAAKQALDSDPVIGLLLPCKIAVYEKNGDNFISLAKPSELLSVASNSELESMGKEIETKLIRVIDDVK